jgi:hypothetical protein
MPYLYIVELHVAVNNIKLLSVALHKQRLSSCTRFSRCEVFHIVHNNIDVFKFSHKVPSILSYFNQI